MGPEILGKIGVFEHHQTNMDDVVVSMLDSAHLLMGIREGLPT